MKLILKKLAVYVAAHAERSKKVTIGMEAHTAKQNAQIKGKKRNYPYSSGFNESSVEGFKG